MTVTDKDITKVAGVSPSTISCSFSKNLGIPKETADRLKINSLKYGKSSCTAARGSKTNHSQVFGYIECRNDPFYSK